MTWRLATVAVLACGVVLAAPVPKKDEKPKPDAEAIQGTWRLEKFEGAEKPPADAGVILLAFKEGKMSVSVAGRENQKGAYQLDATAKPKAIDLTKPGENDARGIYELDGDSLRICLVDDGNAARPTEFTATGKRIMLFVLKRVPDEK